ncbi:hypothetical protein QOZ95_002924 [Paenibacillus brasilensis]|uniref:HAMP domain-containing protein n=1 Tax=Paenibacillus brasilensis TaxID=128574 RepID=A0ABU0L2P2_9BACL|nr:cache domain-containing protein [Paenibacillus brasilensis]MDQ0494757.1 hypothetical protein [Paenibacillus brasilensis]
MRSRFQPLNTLRNQIFIGFILVMLIMMSVAGAFIYLNVSGLLKNSAERHIGQTAVQASGRLDALIGQMDSLTEQVANHPSVQHILLEERNGGKVSFRQRQSLLQVMHSYQAYMPSVGSLELYTAEGKMLFPIREGSLVDRIGQADIQEANQMKGRLVWVGIDPEDPRSLLAIRQVSLVDRWFSRGGYLITRMERGYFGLNDASAVNEEEDENMLLVDRQGQLLSGKPMKQTDLSGILHSRTQTVHIGEREYVKAVQQSERTGWSLLILIPVSVVTDGITVLRTTLIISASLGAVLFLFMSFMLSTLITRPIGHLIQAMRRSREGALVLNPEPAAAVELRELNAEYNTMIVDINELIRVICEKEALQSQTELKALQAQINPHEVEEAAVMDGCSVNRMFFQIVLPMTTPVMATTSIINMIYNWNEFIFVNTFISSDENKTLTVGVQNFIGQYTTDWGAIGATLMISILPILLVFLIMSDRIVEGIAAGSVKG